MSDHNLMPQPRCKHCNEPIPDEARTCIACGEDVGYPNVRYAERSAERVQLRQRVDQAYLSAEAADFKVTLLDFENAAGTSHALIARPLRVLIDMMADSVRPYSTYHQELSAGTRASSPNEFDATRASFENCILPKIYPEVRFALLSLDERWNSWFGPYAILLRENMIEHRASVFEENPITFVKRHNILASDLAPPGYRAIWSNRGKLAVAKLYPNIDKTTQKSDYARIIFPDGNNQPDDDYIEVHIYGPFTRAAISKIIGKKPISREDKTLWATLKIDAIDAGIQVKEI